MIADYLEANKDITFDRLVALTEASIAADMRVSRSLTSHVEKLPEHSRSL